MVEKAGGRVISFAACGAGVEVDGGKQNTYPIASLLHLFICPKAAGVEPSMTDDTPVVASTRTIGTSDEMGT